MRLQRDSYAPKSCAFDAATVQFLRAHLCKSHPVLQHLIKAMAEKRGLSVSGYVACRAYDAASEDKRNEVSAPAAAEKRSPPFSCRKGGDRLRMLISDSEKGEAFT